MALAKGREPTGHGVAYVRSGMGQGSGPIHVTNMTCDGTETHVTQCKFTRLTTNTVPSHCVQ